MKVSTEVLEEARALELRARRLVNTAMAGEHLSIFKGRGIEFQEIREYRPGDDVRAIDWKTTAKLSAPHVRVSVEERELPVAFIVDLSGSMFYGSGEVSKFERLVEIICILGLVAVRDGSPFSLMAFTDRVEFVRRPARGRRALLNLLSALLEYRPGQSGSDLNAAIDAYLRLPFRKGIAFLISDFMAPEFGLSLRTLAVRNDIVPIVITDPREKSMPPAGFVELQDLETGRRTVVDTLDSGFRNFFESAQRRRGREKKRLFEGAGLDWVEVSTSTDRNPFEPLRRFFNKRKR